MKGYSIPLLVLSCFFIWGNIITKWLYDSEKIGYAFLPNLHLLSSVALIIIFCDEYFKKRKWVKLLRIGIILIAIFYGINLIITIK